MLEVLTSYIKFVRVLGPTFTKCNVQLMMHMYFEYVYVRALFNPFTPKI